MSEESQSDSVLLKHALMCEKAAPEVLPFKGDLVTRISTNLETLETKINQLESDSSYELMRTMYQYEHSRVLYMLRSYHRVRTMKIERFVMSILDDDDTVANISEAEKCYAEQYLMLLGGHLKSTVLNYMPESFNGLVKQSVTSTKKDMVVHPNLDTHCFARVNEDLGHVMIDEDGESAEFNKGDLFVVRYRPLRQLLEADKVQLV